MKIEIDKIWLAYLKFACDEKDRVVGIMPAEAQSRIRENILGEIKTGMNKKIVIDRLEEDQISYKRYENILEELWKLDQEN